jgi:hypothetical protein
MILMGQVEYFAVYYTRNKDRHKNVNVENDNFEYMRDYYNSIEKNNLNATIFHDNLSSNFINKYATNKIKFIKQTINYLMQPHDIRFIELYKYLLDNKHIKKICLTDISDVIIIKDCHDLIENNKLYVGGESEYIYENEWFAEYLQYIKEKYKMDILCHDKKILNCGIVCGNREIIMDFLKKIVYLLNKLYIDENTRPLDMFVINHIIYTNFNDQLYIGNNLNTPFGHYIHDEYYYFKHK